VAFLFKEGLAQSREGREENLKIGFEEAILN
jgi:hypothetical protein